MRRYAGSELTYIPALFGAVCRSIKLKTLLHKVVTEVSLALYKSDRWNSRASRAGSCNCVQSLCNFSSSLAQPCWDMCHVEREMAGSSQEIIPAPGRRLPASFFFYTSSNMENEWLKFLVSECHNFGVFLKK